MLYKLTLFCPAGKPAPLPRIPHPQNNFPAVNDLQIAHSASRTILRRNQKQITITAYPYVFAPTSLRPLHAGKTTALFYLFLFVFKRVAFSKCVNLRWARRVLLTRRRCRRHNSPGPQRSHNLSQL